MKKSLLASALAVLTITGCASTQERTSYLPARDSERAIDVDNAYVAEVNRRARIRGVEVQWVNMPRPALAKGD